MAPPSQVDARPYELVKTPTVTAGSDWAAVTQLFGAPATAAPIPTRPQTPINRLAEWVARQPEGNRNAGLFWAANCALEADGGRPRPAGRSGPQAGLDEREIPRTLASARTPDRPALSS